MVVALRPEPFPSAAFSSNGLLWSRDVWHLEAVIHRALCFIPWPVDLLLTPDSCGTRAELAAIAGGGEGRGKQPYRVSIRSPIFITIPFAAKCMIGYKVADIPAIMGSFDPCIGETDR